MPPWLPLLPLLFCSQFALSFNFIGYGWELLLSEWWWCIRNVNREKYYLQIDSFHTHALTLTHSIESINHKLLYTACTDAVKCVWNIDTVAVYAIFYALDNIEEAHKHRHRHNRSQNSEQRRQQHLKCTQLTQFAHFTDTIICVI